MSTLLNLKSDYDFMTDLQRHFSKMLTTVFLDCKSNIDNYEIPYFVVKDYAIDVLKHDEYFFHKNSSDILNTIDSQKIKEYYLNILDHILFSLSPESKTTYEQIYGSIYYCSLIDSDKFDSEEEQIKINNNEILIKLKEGFTEEDASVFDEHSQNYNKAILDKRNKGLSFLSKYLFYFI